MRDPRLWAGAAILGIFGYAAIDVALVFLRPEFSVLHNAESDYGSKGPWSWLMDLNFLLRCAFSLGVVAALALSVPRRVTPALVFLSVWAVCSGLLAFFPDDPVGTPVHGAAKVHLLLAVAAFTAVALGTRIASRRLRRLPAWRPVAVPLTALSWGALVPVVLLAHAHLRPHSLGGLYEKLFLAVEIGWLLLAAAWVAVR